MQKMVKMALALIMGVCLAGTASAGVENITSNITTSDKWTSDNEYHLKDVIFIEPGVTLEIEPGTKIVGYKASELPGSDSSALVVTRGATLIANGTETEPIVFTSSHDTGSWRPVNSEWGNLTILGDAIIAEGTDTGGVQDGTCTDNMEGLTASAFSEYGGDNDDDSSGEISYISLRFGGSVIGLADELNGLSLGGVGRGTDIHHIEIMNNVDDGIEIWGGTVGLKNVSIWNIGDDSFDLDEGYRGKAQFGLIVQGYSTFIEDQGSGNGDNCFEMDGGEHPDDMVPWADPMVYNFTVIGQRTGGDHGLALRDNMRIQLHNSIFMDIGDKLVSIEDGTFLQEMEDAFSTSVDVYDTTDYDATWLASIGGVEALYNTPRTGMWTEIKDCIFYNYSSKGNAAVNGDPLDGGSDVHDAVFGAGARNIDDQSGSGTMPIAKLERDTTTPSQPLGMERVTLLDPRAAGDAVSCAYTAPANDDFFTVAPFIGAFSEKNNWLVGWTAADEYGMIVNTGNPDDPENITIELTATTFFETEDGVTYLVKVSDDNVTWSEFATVVGDGSVMSVTDIDGFDSAKFYMVEVL